MSIHLSILSTSRNWIRRKLFNTWANSVITALIIMALIYFFPKAYMWVVTDAILTIQVDSESWWGYSFVPDSNACIKANGACWDFVAEKFRLIIFGLYPQDQHWRPLVMMITLISLIVYSLDTSRWGFRLGVTWVVAIPMMFFLMQGGVLGLTFVQTDSWGGGPITLILSAVGIVLSFPIAVMLAFGRQSDMLVVKTICIFFIEIIRGVPLITILFMASLMIPLFLPEGIIINKLLRALIGFTLFSAAYVAEVIRGGLQAVPKGQYEAADSLGYLIGRRQSLLFYRKL